MINGGGIIRTDRDGMKQHAAIEKELDRLRAIRPSPAAPLTDEDLAIFQERAAHSDDFPMYITTAYGDYMIFFFGALQYRHQELMEGL